MSYYGLDSLEQSRGKNNDSSLASSPTSIKSMKKFTGKKVQKKGKIFYSGSYFYQHFEIVIFSIPK